MVQESKRPGVTEMHVRMDCNGCVNRIKKAVQGVEGIYEVHVDFHQQKLTVIGRTAPEKIVKAIKKTRRIATICSHTEASSAPEQQPPAGGDPPASANATDPPPVEAPASAAEAPAEQTTQEPPPVPGDTAGEVQLLPEAADAAAAAAASQPGDPPDQEAKDVGEIHMMHHHYPHHHRVYQLDHWPGYHRCWDGYGSDQPEGHYGGSSSSSVIHSYSRYRPGTNMPSEYGYLRPPSQSIWYGTTTTTVAAEPYGEDYCRSSRSAASEGNYNITSMFSDENPNACTVV